MAVNVGQAFLYETKYGEFYFRPALSCNSRAMRRRSSS
jgi:hypothetical protein